MKAMRTNNKTRFYVVAAWLALGVILVGFFKTFIFPFAQGTFSAPPIIYFHGFFLMLWALLFIVQSTLIQTKRVRIHQRLGLLGAALVPCVVFSTLGVGIFALKRDVLAGGGQTAISSLIGSITAPLLFTSLVAAALLYRRRPEFHKRLMLLAMIAIIWPAFFRFRHYFPSVPKPEIVFALIIPQSMVFLAMLLDKIRDGRVHPVYLNAGMALVAENVAEACFFDTSGWRVMANWLAGFFI